MYSQQRFHNSVVLVYFATVLCSILTPIMAARNLEMPKTEMSDNDLTRTSSNNGNINNQFNTASTSAYYTTKHNLRSMLMAPRDNQQKVHSKLSPNLDLMNFLLEYEDEDRSKRFDDYGHMRFGKRGGEEQFDDYGHMRFGRST